MRGLNRTARLVWSSEVTRSSRTSGAATTNSASMSTRVVASAAVPRRTYSITSGGKAAVAAKRQEGTVALAMRCGRNRRRITPPASPPTRTDDARRIPARRDAG